MMMGGGMMNKAERLLSLADQVEIDLQDEYIADFMREAVTYIERLEAENAELRRDRDRAQQTIEQMESLGSASAQDAQEIKSMLARVVELIGEE